MWRPQTYDEIKQTLGSAEEGQQLDFKRELSSTTDKKDLGKDAAAMSFDGGVILIGVEEDANAVATAMPGVPLSGTPEQVRQIIDSRVYPPLPFRIETLKENASDTDGVVLIEISPSFSTPHMFDHRYPARSGATTRWLEEREVADLYERRSRGPLGDAATEGIDNFIEPIGAGPRHGGVGYLSVHIRPVAPWATRMRPGFSCRSTPLSATH